MSSKCPACLFNTENDFYDAGVEERGGKLIAIDECVKHCCGYPYVKDCASYEAAHQQDEE